MQAWGFIWIMLILKIPLFGLLYIVWWAIHEVDDPAEDDGQGGDGGTKVPPRPRLPRRRGPHGDTPPVAPPRVRTSGPPREHESA
ncbi:MAG: hypothetical protein HZB46_13440 [Solirubrobacterales bacterium]|nr:hypothetical protein [Solirubrobacterales bacterium]